MTCCNRRRTQLATTAARRPAPARTVPARTVPASTVPVRATEPGDAAATVQLRFTGSRPVRVEGVASGQVYRAAPATPLISTRPEDVRSLLRSGLFVPATPQAAR